MQQSILVSRWACTVFCIFVACFSSFASADNKSNGETKGRVIGVSEEDIHPDWWKQSFLDIAEDAVEAGEEGKHLIIFFYLEGCPYCIKMSNEHFTDSPYIDFLKDNFDVVAMNVLGSLEVTNNDGRSLTEKELATELHVRFTPGMMFFGADGEQVLRLDGYRSHKQFEHVLRYVATRSYEQKSISDYVGTIREGEKATYALLDNPVLTETNNLSDLPDQPIMLIFEDKTCAAECTEFHEKFLGDPETQRLIEMMTVVRWDALSTKKVIDHQGNTTTPRDFAAAQNIVYRPGVILIDRGEVKARRNSYAVLHHFLGGLEYIATRAYLQQSRTEFGEARQRRILDSGQDIDLRI